MATKKTKFNKSGIENLPNNRPVVYKIVTKGGRSNYTGVAQRGRVQSRLKEHLGKIPGATVRIEQAKSITEAGEEETRIISRSKPKYNKQGK